jgi:hypothetical protein
MAVSLPVGAVATFGDWEICVRDNEDETEFSYCSK